MKHQMKHNYLRKHERKVLRNEITCILEILDELVGLDTIDTDLLVSYVKALLPTELQYNAGLIYFEVNGKLPKSGRIQTYLEGMVPTQRYYVIKGRTAI